MFEREMARLVAAAEVDATDVRSMLRREVEAFAWELVSRLACTVPDDEIGPAEIPLDRTVARG